MKEDAVSPVVAAMLLLAVFVTFFAAWNAVYVPSMKAQSEMTHLRQVESGVLRFSSDIDTAASLKRNMHSAEAIPLGGGEFTFDSARSGGMIRIRNETEGYLRLTITKENPPETETTRMRFSRFTYEPVGNFWQDQGYSWEYGMVNVTKGDLSTPLQFPTMEDVTYDMTGSLFDLDVTPSPATPSACTVMNVYPVNLSPADGHLVSSGSGNGMLGMESTVTNRQFSNATTMTVDINPGMPEGFQDALWESVNRSIAASESCSNIHVYRDYPDREIVVTFESIPNMTLNRKTTEISIGAY